MNDKVLEKLNWLKTAGMNKLLKGDVEALKVLDEIEELVKNPEKESENEKSAHPDALVVATQDASVGVEKEQSPVAQAEAFNTAKKESEESNPGGQVHNE